MSIDIKNLGTTKPMNSRIHTIKRAKERYNLILTTGDIERLELRVRMQHEVFFLERKSKTRTVWLARVENMIVVAIYNNKQKCVATVMPVYYAKRYFNTEENEWEEIDIERLEKRIKNQQHDVFFLERRKTPKVSKKYRHKKKKESMWIGRIEHTIVFVLYDDKNKCVKNTYPAKYAKRYFSGEKV